MDEVLAEHPELKVYVMHASFPHLEDMIDLLDAYPELYVDITLPRDGGFKYLKGLVEAGHADRLMFGSGQQVWPQLIDARVKAIEKFDVLTEEQTHAIFYENAARFFGIEGGKSGSP